jgi:hypothetical protein
MEAAKAKNLDEESQEKKKLWDSIVKQLAPLHMPAVLVITRREKYLRTESYCLLGYDAV